MIIGKDDWDEALEEAEKNAILRGDIKPHVPYIPASRHEYGKTLDIAKSDLADSDTLLDCRPLVGHSFLT